jgi:hypothetical protein
LPKLSDKAVALETYISETMISLAMTIAHVA